MSSQDDPVDLAGKDDVRSKDPKSYPNIMDARLEMCFLNAIQFSLKKTELPLLASTFYQNHMTKYCPTGEHLEIKKSSYKTFSKFLKKQGKAGLITVKMRSKGGGECIVGVDKSHSLQQDMRVCSTKDTEAAISKERATAMGTRPPITGVMFELMTKTIKIYTQEHAPYRSTTVIENLDEFGIELKEFCDTVHRKLGCGASVSHPHADPTNDERPKVLVQGNQIEPVGDILINEYGVPRKLITSVIHDEDADVPEVVLKEKKSFDKKIQKKMRNSLSITGISEQKHGEDIKELIIGLARDLKVDMCKADIDRCERVGKPRLGRKRKILVEFASMSARQDLFMKRRGLRKIGTWDGVYINEELTPYREELSYHARRYARAKLIKSTFTQDGNVFVIDNFGKKHTIMTSEELTAFGVLDQPDKKPKQFNVKKLFCDR